VSVQSYVQVPERDSSDNLAPFDWGLGFAFAHWRALIQIALAPALIKVGLRYFEFFRPLSLRQSFLIAAIDVGTKAWLLASIMLLSILVLQGSHYRVSTLLQRALFSMPKVLLSSFVLLMVVGAFFLAPWMYLFVLFVVWAPFFCAAEITAKSFREEADDFEYELEEGFEEALPRMKPRVVRYFADRPIWDLGFARSIQFAANRRNFIATVQLALLLLLALTLPLATVVAVTGFYHNFGWIIFESFFSYIIHSLVIGIGCATFLRLLPKEIFDEIGVLPESVTNLKLRKPFRLHGRIFPFFFLALLGGLATKATIDYIIVNNSKPPSLISALEKVEKTDYQVIVTLRLEDRASLFRWLNPQSFQLEYLPEGAPGGGEVEKTAANASSDSANSSAKTEVKKVELLEPERVIPYSLDGKLLPEDGFVPSSKPLKLVLYYERQTPEAKSAKRFILHYVPLIGEEERFVEGPLDGDKRETENK